ncbi:hypothetical protein [Streptomyces sp. NPDC056061]|uniref:hypothetical protein n=1 Tax=Streptomyces sp. NPDC056061 TaxID=3345700 RepID=UPI0035DBA564
MKYEMCATQFRTAHDYLNLVTGEVELIRRYGAYDVQESFLQPDGRILLLAHGAHCGEPYVVGVHNASSGVYWSDEGDARRHYGWRIAESFGLVVEKEGSVAVVPASREYATDLVKKIKQDCAEWNSGAVDAEEVGDRLVEHASSLAKHLQRTGVLSARVFESWEAVG